MLLKCILLSRKLLVAPFIFLCVWVKNETLLSCICLCFCTSIHRKSSRPTSKAWPWSWPSSGKPIRTSLPCWGPRPPSRTGAGLWVMLDCAARLPSGCSVDSAAAWRHWVAGMSLGSWPYWGDSRWGKTLWGRSGSRQRTWGPSWSPWGRRCRDWRCREPVWSRGSVWWKRRGRRESQNTRYSNYNMLKMNDKRRLISLFATGDNKHLTRDSQRTTGGVWCTKKIKERSEGTQRFPFKWTCISEVSFLSISTFNFETNATDKNWRLSVSRGPDELEETTAETDPYIFVSSGYF